VVGFLKSHGLELPLSSHILIATSGGSDSVGLAHLMIHFGRRIVPKDKIILLHINHGWRNEESDQDENFVRELGERWGVPFHVHRLAGPPTEGGVSWEEEARQARKKIFAEEASRLKAQVFTAHQADDLAETLLWRLFTGASQTHGGGVAVRHGVEIRPFLRARKKVIESYLEEVSESFRTDSTNQSERFLRSRMRKQLMPEVEKLFPKAIDHLIELALKAQLAAEQEKVERMSFKKVEDAESLAVDSQSFPWEVLFRAAGLKARRAHLETLFEKVVAKKDWYGEIHLPGGWRLTREKKGKSQLIQRMNRAKAKRNVQALEKQGPEKNELPKDRWILERL
jgi:tRNA(Ile)-lysidine synthase